MDLRKNEPQLNFIYLVHTHVQQTNIKQQIQ